MFHSNRLVYKEKAPEGFQNPESRNKPSNPKKEYEPRKQKGVTREMESTEREKDSKKCEELEKSMETADELRSSYFGLVDVLFSQYRRYWDEEVSPKYTDLRKKLDGNEQKATNLLKDQFDEWIGSVDLCDMKPQEVEDMMMSYYRSLQAHVAVWQAYEKAGVPRTGLIGGVRTPGYAYSDVLEFAKLCPLGSGKLMIIDPYKALALSMDSATDLVYDVKSLDWEKNTSAKLEYLRKRFGEISVAFDFPGIGYWESENKKTFIDKTVDAIKNHPNFHKMDAYTVLRVLGSFTEQCKFHTEQKNYSAERVVREVTDHLNSL